MAVGASLRSENGYHIVYTVFIIFVVFVVFGLMNILTAVVVESTGSIVDTDRELMIEEQLSNENSHANRLKAIFIKADTDNNGTLSKEELNLHLRDKKVRTYLGVLNVSMACAEAVYDIMSLNGTSEVDIETYVRGLLFYSGPAQHVDVAALLHERHLQRKFSVALTQYLDRQFTEIRSKLHVVSKQRFNESP